MYKRQRRFIASLHFLLLYLSASFAIVSGIVDIDCRHWCHYFDLAQLYSKCKLYEESEAIFEIAINVAQQPDSVHDYHTFFSSHLPPQHRQQFRG